MRSRAEDPDAWALAAAMRTSWVPFMLQDPVGKVRSVPLPWPVGRTDMPVHGWDAVLLESAGADDGPVTGVASLL